MTFSQGTRSLEMARFWALSLADNGFFLPSFFVGEAEDAARRFFHDNLSFQCVPLLLARVVAPLFFWGVRWVFR
jgi:hypothetical protein